MEAMKLSLSGTGSTDGKSVIQGEVSMKLTGLKFTRRGVVLAGVAAIFYMGCTDFSSPPEVLGHLIVTAKDQGGTPVAGAKFTAFLADRTTAWGVATTGASGSGEFRENDGGILPQTYIVRFDRTTPDYALAPGESDDKPITVVIGQTQTVSFVLKKGTIGDPGGGG
jgi:hypothetical protein